MTSPYPALVEAPTPVPWGFGLLSVATVIEPSDVHQALGVIYRSPYCSGGAIWLDPCITGEPAEDKLPTDTELDPAVAGTPFVVYDYLSCRETTLEALRARAREVLAIHEQRVVEAHFWATHLSRPDADAEDQCEVLNASSLGADAFSVVGGISALEQAMAAAYGGRATIHAPRGIAAFMARDGQMERTNANTLQTALGTQLAFYGGATNTGPDGTAAPAGFAWLYATSQVTLRKFGVDVYPEMQQMLALPTNEPIALAEQVWVATTECACFAVLVAVDVDAA